MIPLAHLGGVPLEELLPALAGPSAGLLAARACLNLRLRRDQHEDQR